MWRLWVIAVFLVCSSIQWKNYYAYSNPVFAVRIAVGSNSQMMTYACFLDNGRVLTKKRICDRDTFIKFVSGHWPSIYNPQRINYFELHGIQGGVLKDSITNKEYTYCPSLDSLWKVRYGTYPFRNGSGLGWSNKYMKPSPLQEQYLYQRYNVGHIDTDFFMDTSFWQLLNDVRDTGWIRSYRKLK
ncbi:MAG: hypothetical protein ACO2Z9_09360 [Crocinitomicaceae bacterium]